MKPTIKYLHNGVYQYATVKDIGDIEQLATVVKTDLVGAINSILGNVPENYQTLIDDLNTQLDTIASAGLNTQQTTDMETAISTLQAQVALDLSNQLTAMNLAYDTKFADITLKYDADVLAINNEITGVKGNLTATEADLTAVEGRLSTAELNVTNVTQEVDTVQGELLTKVSNTDFDLLESTVSQHSTSLTQNADAIALKASQESLDLATGRITDAEASIVVNADAITTTVKKAELKGELQGLDIYAPNIMNNTMDWYEWNSTIPAKAYKLIDTYQHTIIQEQLGFGGYFEDVLTGLTVGATYTASVWGKSNVSTVKPVFVVDGVNHAMANANGDLFLGTTWQRFKIAFVATDTEVIVGFATTNSVDGNITHFAGGKLETGSLNTGWRPNDGDANVRVATAESTIIQQADQITQIVTKQTEVDGTVSQQRTEINQMADSIELQATAITDAEGRLSSAESSLTLQAGEIALKVEQTDVDLAIGDIKLDNRNHVLNSNFLREFEDWTNVSNDYSIIEIGTKKYARISRSGLYSNLVSSMSTNKIFVKKNDKLLIGCDIIVDGVAGYDIQKPFMVEFFDINDIRVDYKEYSIADFGVTLASRVEERLTTNITVDRDDVAKMCVKLTLYRNGIVSYSNVSVQKGDIGTGGWSPAPEDNQMIQASMKSEIIQNAESIALKADQSVVDGLSGNFTQMSADLTVANDAITANVDEMTRIDGVVTQHGLDITATAQEMTTKMTSLQVEDLLTGKAYATQSQLTQTSDSIILSVTNMGTQVEELDAEVKATKFMWVMWADDELGNGISADATGKLYIGTAYNKPTIEGSLIATDYVWKKIVGDNADNPITLSLTADRHSVPTLADGTGGDYGMAKSTLTVLNGGTIDTANWIVTVNVSAGVEGLLTGYQYKVNNITNDTGAVEFVVTQGETVLKKTFTVTKDKQGADAISYKINKSHSIIIRKQDGTLSPQLIDLTSVSATGNGDYSSFNGYFKIYERALTAMTIDEYTTLEAQGFILPDKEYLVADVEHPYVFRYLSPSAESYIFYTPSANSEYIHIEFYSDQALTTLVSTENIAVSSDGQDVYKTEVLSSNGERFYKNMIDSVITARVKKGTEDITDSIPDAYFLWRRVSNDPSGDTVWNNNHAGMKQITITNEDVYVKAVFNCDVLG